MIASVVVIGYVVLLAVHVLSLRVELFRGEIHVASWLTRRRYRLADGAVTRLRVPPRQSWFGTQLGSFGIEIGLGLLRGRDEELEVLRLAPNSPMIVVPCIGTRLAITPSSEERFVRALATAAGVEQPPHPQPVRASR